MRPTLCLFDIDGTLVDTGGAGMAALRDTACEIFGEAGPELDLAGATDLGIIAGVLEHFNQPATSSSIDAYLKTYHRRLEWNLEHGDFGGRVLSGVIELLELLSLGPGVHLGLLTGNTRIGAEIKLRHFGLHHHFGFGAYGCDAADRNQLGPRAIERARKHTGIQFTSRDTWVIGDTPKDVACAQAVGARCLAVCTGRFNSSELLACGADLALPTLENVGKWWHQDFDCAET